MIKAIVKRVLRFLAKPWRVAKNKRYFDADAAAMPRTEIANEVLLPMVRDAIKEGNTAVIYVKGYSMRPFLEHLRDRVKLAPVTTLAVGDAVLAEISPLHFVLHRIIEIDGEHITLMGDGNCQGTEHCERKDVCGVVVEYIRPNGHVLYASDVKLQRKIQRWKHLLPLRRWLLAFYNLSIEPQNK